jgi:hypothetical protein
MNIQAGAVEAPAFFWPAYFYLPGKSLTEITSGSKQHLSFLSSTTNNLLTLLWMPFLLAQGVYPLIPLAWERHAMLAW